MTTSTLSPMHGVTVLTRRNLAEQTPESRLRNIHDEIARQLAMNYDVQISDFGQTLAAHGIYAELATRLARTLQRHFPDFDLGAIVRAARTFDDIVYDIAQGSAAAGEQSRLY